MRGPTACALTAIGLVALLGTANAVGSSGPTCFGMSATIVGSGTITGTSATT